MSDAINPDHYKQLPAEAIEIIEAAINKAPSNRDAYLHGQVLKYVLRCWNKNGIEDLRKAKWYLDRLIESFEANEPEQPAIKQSLTTEPPDGWRWLEVGEVIRKGDQGFEKGRVYAIEPMKIGMTLQSHWMPTIRRNRFEVGEKVVRVSNGVVYKVVRILSMGYQLEYEFGAEVILHGKDLAPYIEDAK